MRFLLTSAGIKNASIRDTLVDLLGKPIAESSALCIPTAAYGHPRSVPALGHGGHQRTRRPHPDVRAGSSSAGSRRQVATERWESSTFDLSAPGSRGHAGQFHGRGRTMGGRIPNPAYAIDDQTAIKVSDGTVEVISEGHWKLFSP